MASITFLFAPSTRGSDYKGSIRLRLIHCLKVKVLTIPYKIYPEEWDKHSSSIIYPQEASARTTYLEQLELWMKSSREKLTEIIDELESQGRYSLDDIVQHYALKTNNGKLQSYVEELALGLIRNGQERTAAAYRTAARTLIKFNRGKA